MSLGVLPYRNDRSNLLARLQLKQVDDCGTARGSACLWNLISLHAVYTAGIREEHQVMVRCRHQKFLDVIVINGLHSLDSLAPAVLRTEIVKAHTLDISKLRHGNDGIGNRNQILHGNIIFVKTDGCSSVIPVLVGDQKNLLTDDAEQLFLVGKNCLQLCDALHQFRVFVLQLLAFQTCQRTQTHIHDRLCLYVRQRKTLH